MRYEITVADRETGEEFVLELLAETPQDATVKANAAGYLVGEIEPAPEITAKAFLH